MAVEIAIRYYPTQLVSSMRFTDIHCHLLPGIDDGAKNWDDTTNHTANIWRRTRSKKAATPLPMSKAAPMDAVSGKTRPTAVFWINARPR